MIDEQLTSSNRTTGYRSNMQSEKVQLKKLTLSFSSLLPLVVVLVTALVPQITFAKIIDSTGQPYTPLKPTPEQKRTGMEIVDRLNYSHYQELAIDDRLSSRIYDRYIRDLDTSRSYFLQSDIDEFEKYRYSIDDTLKVGELSLGFEIYNRYQQRVVERLTFMIRDLEDGIEDLDFTQDEFIETDRENAPWPKTKKELEYLWRKRLKGAVLGLRLAKKPHDEIRDILLKRYRSNLNRTRQANNEDAFQTYINALAQTYDPHTLYYSPRSSENFNINMSLSLEGIGAVLQTENEYTKVVRLVPAGPADKSKQLHPADRIIGVAQADAEMVDVIGWRIDEVVELIRGKKGSVVRLEIIPRNAANDQETKIVSITRNTVKLEEQAAKTDIIQLDEGGKPFKLGVITIPTFYVDFKGMQNRDPNYKSTTRDVRKLLTELKEEKVDGLVIDLRNNGGGALTEVNSLLGLFIKSGPTVQVRDDRGRTETYRDSDPRVFYEGPMAVLVNRLSASASEIFAGAIQDYKRGLILGNQTFGKGTVQALRSLNRGQLKITQAKFYRISGGSNQNLGVLPDIALPGLYDKDEIGESALENALPWDTIAAARYQEYGNYSPLLEDLKGLHSDRVKTNPDFIHWVDLIELNQAIRADTKISLNEKTRLRQREEAKEKQLSLENKRRKSKGLEPLKELAELDEEETVENEESKEKDLSEDVILTESGHILKDYVLLNDRRIAKHQVKVK